jgi:hypothetical protein
MYMKHPVAILTVLLLATVLSGCGSPFRDLHDLKGDTKHTAQAQLGEPTEKASTIFKPEGYGAHRSLDGIIPVGHPYELWVYKNKGDTHSVFFADVSNPKSDPKGWIVVYTSTLEKGSVY